MRTGITGLLGINNSGKSSCKFFYELSSVWQVSEAWQRLEGEATGFSKVGTVFEHDEIFCAENNRDIEVELSFESLTHEGLSVPTKIQITVKRNPASYSAKFELGGKLYEAGRNGIVIVDGSDVLNIAGFGALRLSSVRKVFEGSKLLCGAHEILRFVGDYYDLHIGNKFVDDWRTWQSGYTRKERETILQITSDIRTIFGFDDLFISASLDNEILQLNVDGRSFKLPELGSGIAQFILVLASAAFKKPSYILIDEPESNLHPSLQLDFLTADLRAKRLSFRDTQFWFGAGCGRVHIHSAQNRR